MFGKSLVTNKIEVFITWSHPPFCVLIYPHLYLLILWVIIELYVINTFPTITFSYRSTRNSFFTTFAFATRIRAVVIFNCVIIMAPKLYLTETSPPVRSILITAAALGLELDKQEVDVLQKEHLTPEFIKVRPLLNLQVVPSLCFRHILL